MESHDVRMAQIYQAQAARIGYTDHHPGMYADRFTHKNLQTEAGRYNWLNNKYEVFHPLPLLSLTSVHHAPSPF